MYGWHDDPMQSSGGLTILAADLTERVSNPIGELWRRVGAVQEPLDQVSVLIVAAVVMVVVASPAGYRLVRHLITLVHEAGHALVAVLSGRRLSGIRLHADTSGVTVSRGRPRGPGMVATLLAGYPAPALVGLGGAWLLGAGYAAASLWALVLTCAVMLLLVRNLYGLWVVLVTGGVVAGLSWLAPDAVIQWAAYLVVLALLVGAPRSVVELRRGRSARRGLREKVRHGGPTRGGGSSDADQLAALTGVPAGLWTAVFWIVTVGCLVLGGWILWP